MLRVLLTTIALTSVAALLMLLTEAEAEARHQRIVGGSDANITDFPWQVSVSEVINLICGGAIISQTWMLTAASCVQGIAQSNISIRAGSADSHSGGYLYQVAHMEIPELYVPGEYDYDIAAIRVPIPFILGATMSPVKLPAAGAVSPAPATPVRAAGWGSVSEDPAAPQRTLQWAALLTVAREECAAAYEGVAPVTERMLCAVGQQQGVDLCVGDAGDALVDGDVLVGLASWGRGCARDGFPGVYTDVAALRDWIVNVTGVSNP